MPTQAKQFLEFFAGIGLVYDALRRTDWACSYANDMDPHKQKIYEAHFGRSDYWHLEDVWQTDAVLERITGSPFLATASFPCTDMSLAGQMQGFAGSQSSAFFGFTSVLERLGERRPPMVMLENVVGLLTARGGADFRAAAEHLSRLGYWLDAFRLDAKHFVPQSRPRLFLIGMLSAPEEPRPSETDSLPSALRPARLLEMIESTSLATGWRLSTLPEPPPRVLQLDQLIDTGPEQPWWDAAQVERHYAMLSDAHRLRVDAWSTANSVQVATAFRRIRHGEQRLEVRSDQIAGCLRTPKGGSARQIVLAHHPRRGLAMRWMSPREYARLQGAGDYRWGEAADSRVLYGFGDAVCVPAIRWIDEHVLTPHFLASQRRHTA